MKNLPKVWWKRDGHQLPESFKLSGSSNICDILSTRELPFTLRRDIRNTYIHGITLDK